MNQKLIKFVVILLGVLIIILFIAIIYGSYLKLKTKNHDVTKEISLDLKSYEKIIDIKPIDKNNILIIVGEDEKKRMEHTIRTLYADFVTKVAAGRDIPLEEVETLAQGRIWSGRAAVANGLVDELGGLARAVQLAKEKAGIPHQSVQLVERPQRALFNTNFFKPALLSSQSRQRDLVTHLQFRLEHNGQPLLLVPAETLETFYNEEDSK